MTTSPTPQFEIPNEMRKVAERNVEQPKLALSNFMQAAQEAVSSLEKQIETSQGGALDISEKAMSSAERYWARYPSRSAAIARSRACAGTGYGGGRVELAHDLPSSRVLASARERRRLVKKARIVDLCDEEVCHISARDEPGGPVARIDQHTICARARSVGQDGWTKNRPIEPAPADDTLRQVLVGVDTPEEEARARHYGAVRHGRGFRRLRSPLTSIAMAGTW